MTNDPWGLGPPQSPPPPHPAQRYPDQLGQFDQVGQFGQVGQVGQVAPPSRQKVTAIVLVALVIVGSMVAAALVVVLPVLRGEPIFGSSGGLPPMSVPTPSGTQATPPTTRVTALPTPPRTPTPTERTGRDEPNRNPDSVSVVSGSAGNSCITGPDLSTWGGYPLASCRTWKASSGLVTGAALSRKDLTITCQADLGEQNPIYTAGQTNTWWVWTQADDGTWDWFPETAIAQGASDQPVNGIARCQ